MLRFLLIILFTGSFALSGCHHSRRAAVDAAGPSDIDNASNTEQLSATRTLSFVDVQPAGDTETKQIDRIKGRSAMTLPTESVFEIDGTFGCRVGMPYKVTITQKNDDIRYSAKVFFDEMVDEPVDCEKFKDLWAACEQADLSSLGDSYGESLGTADFHGTLTCRAQFGDRTVSKGLALTYGKIKDRSVAQIFDAIMQAVPPDAHLPFYSIKTIDYSVLPLHAVFHLKGTQFHPSSVYDIEITQEGEAMHCRIVLAAQGVETNNGKSIPPDKFSDFWKSCSLVDLASLADSYGDIQTYGDFQWDLTIEVATRNGQFTRDILFANQEISDARFARLVTLILNLADTPVNIPVTENPDKTTAQLNPL